MNNPKYIFFPFLRLVYYIRALIGTVTALLGIGSLISGEQEVYQFILSVIATVLTFFIGRSFNEENFTSKIPILFSLFALKEAADLILTVVLKADKHLPSAIILFALTFIFYTVMAVLCRFKLRGVISDIFIYIAIFCLSATPAISFWSVMENAFLQGEPQIVPMSISLVGTVVATLFNFVTVYVCATRKAKVGETE